MRPPDENWNRVRFPYRAVLRQPRQLEESVRDAAASGVGVALGIFCANLIFAFLFVAAAEAASIEGVVVENRSGRPVARARVSLEVVEGAVTAAATSVLTDSGGRFRFPSLTAGTYQLSAQKTGFVSGKFGQQTWNSPAGLIAIGGDDTFYATIRLFRPGAVSGAVLDENGLGMPDCPVYAFRIENRLRMAATATSDDRGHYRISGLQPGQYLIASAGRVLEDGTGLLSTYYGQAVSRQDALRVDVTLEEEITGIDITPIPGTPGTIRGVVAGPGASSVILISEFGNLETELKAGGSFQFSGLSPGRYELLAEGGSAEAPLAAAQKVQISGGVQTVFLQLAPLPAVSLQCVDSQSGKPVLEPVPVFFQRSNSPQDPPRRVDCGKPERLPPGEWLFSVASPTHAYVDRVDGAAQSDKGFEIELQSEDKRIVVLLAKPPATLTGVVRGDDRHPAIGAPVFLRATDHDVSLRVGGPKFSITDAEGRFRFDGLAPGRYEAISSFDLKINDLSAWNGGGGVSVEVAEGQQREIDLRVERLR